MSAQAYIECSAKTNSPCVREVFELAALASIGKLNLQKSYVDLTSTVRRRSISTSLQTRMRRSQSVNSALKVRASMVETEDDKKCAIMWRILVECYQVSHSLITFISFFHLQFTSSEKHFWILKSRPNHLWHPALPLTFEVVSGWAVWWHIEGVLYCRPIGIGEMNLWCYKSFVPFPIFANQYNRRGHCHKLTCIRVPTGLTMPLKLVWT